MARHSPTTPLNLNLIGLSFDESQTPEASHAFRTISLPIQTISPLVRNFSVTLSPRFPVS
jgi:hypothetical protein